MLRTNALLPHLLAALLLAGCTVPENIIVRDSGADITPPDAAGDVLAIDAPDAGQDAADVPDGGGCTDGGTACGARCVDLQTDPNHCGACGRACMSNEMCVRGACMTACPAGQSLCGSTCVNPANDPMHCGRCGNACSNNGGTPVCVGGICMTICAMGRSDCDADPANGCESDPRTDVRNCGACGRPCPSGPNSTANCMDSTCVLACAPGFANCDGNPANGCETDLRSSVANCGACGTACNFPNAVAACSSSACAIVACNPGFGNCDGNPANGCETDLSTSAANCGTCGNACPAGQFCSMGSCATSCSQTLCGTSCVNTTTDVANCGGCGNACSAGANSTATCTGGTCGLTCSAGYGNCDGMAGNGCETALTTVTNCGMCGRACAAALNASATCTAGTCGFACNTGFGDCDPMTAGCETNLNTDVANCGMCGHHCATGQVCTSGTCACPAGTTLCGGTCVNLSTDAANCGACNTACPSGQACSAGRCVTSCPSGQTACGTSCVDLQTDPSNCGACRRWCSTGQICSAGACECPSGQMLCSGSCVDTTSDVSNCGRCGNNCSSDQVCMGGLCRCPSGQTECSGACVNLQLDNNNCGRCGRRCAMGETCSNGMCCPSGQTNCGGTCVDTAFSRDNCGACGHTCPSGQVCSNGTCGTPPPNDTCSGATVVTLNATGVTTVTTTTVNATRNISLPCGRNGADVFLRFTLSQRELVYVDTIGSSYDTMLAFAGGCGDRGVPGVLSGSRSGEITCNDDISSSGVCGGGANLQSTIVAVLPAGTYHVVVAGYANATGPTTVRFQHLPVPGSGSITFLPAGTSTQSGSTSGMSGLAPSGCTMIGFNATGPENHYVWRSCPDYAGGPLTASACMNSLDSNSWDALVYYRSGATGTVACSMRCGAMSRGTRVTTTVPRGPGIHAVTIDGEGTNNSGSYTLNVNRP